MYWKPCPLSNWGTKKIVNARAQSPHEVTAPGTFGGYLMILMGSSGFHRTVGPVGQGVFDVLVLTLAKTKGQ